MKALILVLLLAATVHAEPNGTVVGTLSVAVVKGMALEIRLAADGTLPNGHPQGFGAHLVGIRHDYFRLDTASLNALVDGLDAWLEEPHSVEIFDPPPGGLAVFGNAWNPAHGGDPYPPVVVFQIYRWTTEGPVHSHGGTYVALGVEDTQALANTLRTWLNAPYYQSSPIYQRTLY